MISFYEGKGSDPLEIIVPERLKQGCTAGFFNQLYLRDFSYVACPDPAKRLYLYNRFVLAIASHRQAISD